MLLAAIVSKQQFPTKKELSRKIVHIGTGPIIPLAWWLKIPANLAIGCSLIITIALIINNWLRLVETFEDVTRQTYGTIAYGISITLLLIMFWPNKASAVSAGVLVMAFGDGFAGLIGRQLSSPSWTVFGQRKSVAGSLSMGIVGGITLFLISSISGVNCNPIHIVGISFLAIFLEQIGPYGIDNLTVPIGVAYAWSWFTGS